ncbi:hypothetical protein Anas_10247 [Armadillidium nasatum]|uniref:Uncharacterized protein n=1 Tax=Armadillidium nasatum TaxID=96803 RepID=A0A5N5TDY0_9CRUS|nr:hypothetical protein Anas_10247 [Armadillidium nasatum]
MYKINRMFRKRKKAQKKKSDDWLVVTKMVHPNNETTKMGQAGLCTAPPQTDSPLNSGLDSYPQELISNGSSNDIILSEKVCSESYNKQSFNAKTFLSSDSTFSLRTMHFIATVSALLENKADVKTEDLLLKLRSLINENLELKDTITQNNLALRQQMNLLVQWHQQVENQQRHFREELNNAHKQSKLHYSRKILYLNLL